MEIKRKSSRQLLAFMAWAVLFIEIFTALVMFSRLGIAGSFRYYYRLFSHDVYLSFLMLDLWLAYLLLAIWFVQDALKRKVDNFWWWLTGFLTVGTPVMMWYFIRREE
ncbi:MAG: hypothetical protein ACE5GM_04385 [bacterium]